MSASKGRRRWQSLLGYSVAIVGALYLGRLARTDGGALYWYQSKPATFNNVPDTVGRLDYQHVERFLLVLPTESGAQCGIADDRITLDGLIRCFNLPEQVAKASYCAGRERAARVQCESLEASELLAKTIPAKGGVVEIVLSNRAGQRSRP